MNRRLRIAWLAPFPAARLADALDLARRPPLFHACSWIVNLSGALAARPDVDLHLVTECPYVRRNQVVTRDQITYHFVRTGLPLIHRGYPSWCPLDMLSGFRLSARALGAELRRIAPDLVHAHGTEASYAVTGLAAGVPCLISIQGIITEYHKTNPCFQFRCIQRLEQQQVRTGRYFTCRTAFDSGFVRSVNSTAHIFMIHEAMHPAYFTTPWQCEPADNTILFVGSLAKRKGLATLLAAVRDVAAQHPAVQVRVIGGGSAAEFERLCAATGTTGRATFLGFRSAEEIAAEHRRAQLFVLPSENENSPNSLAEAMVSGMPVIASRVGGIPSMVEDGVTGVLVEPRQTAALAARLSELLTAPDRRARLGQAAAAVARARHWPVTVAEQTMAAYREILANTTP